jgi:hypothetical protein
MSNTTTRMRGTRKPAGAPSKGSVPKGKVRHIHVAPADNGGFTVDSDHELEGKPGKKGDSLGIFPRSKQHTAVFGNPADTLKHLGGLIGAGSAAQGAETPAEESAEEAPEEGQE